MTQVMRLTTNNCGHFKADDGTTQEIKKGGNRTDELNDVTYEIEVKLLIWAHWQK